MANAKFHMADLATNTSERKADEIHYKRKTSTKAQSNRYLAKRNKLYGNLLASKKSALVNDCNL